MTVIDFKTCKILVGFLLVIFILQSASLEISFGLKDNEVNEIILAGDVNVSMICIVPIVLIANITITTNNGQIVSTNTGNNNFVEYVISKVTKNNTGNYSCLVTYSNEQDETLRAKVKSLLLFVRKGGPVCFRNGTGIGEPYTVGDTLLLSCYCRLTEGDCIWSNTVVGSTIKLIDERKYNNKIIRRIVVGPLNNDTDMITRYDCSQGSGSAERCSIGPALNSSLDLILSSTSIADITPQHPVIDTLAEETTAVSSSNINSHVSSSRVPTLPVTRPEFNLTPSVVPNANVSSSDLSSDTGFTTATVTSRQLNSVSSLMNLFPPTESSLGLGLGFNTTTNESNGYILYLIFALVGVLLLTAFFMSMLTLLLCRRRRRHSETTVIRQHVVNVDAEPHSNAYVRSSNEYSDYFDNDNFRVSFASSMDSMTPKCITDHAGTGIELSTFSGDPCGGHNDA